MIKALLVLVLLGIFDPSTSVSISHPKNKDTHCPKKVVQNIIDLQKLRLKARMHQTLYQSQLYNTKLDPNLQAIVHGSRANHKDYPWVTLVHVLDRYYNTIKTCSGVALSGGMMMTVAHCTPRHEEELLAVLVGFEDLSNAGQESDSVTFVHYDEIYAPWQYGSNWGKLKPEDIALFPYNRHRADLKTILNNLRYSAINRYPLLNQYKGWLKHGQYCLVLGFGLVNSKKKTKTKYLQRGRVNILKETGSPLIEYRTHYRGGPCAGDVGGPLICTVAKKARVVGLILENFHRKGINDTCDLSDPKVITGQAVKIADNWDFINSVWAAEDPYRIP